MLTNLGLVEHCKMALREKWIYLWGTYGKYFTKGLLNQKLEQYPKEIGKHIEYIRSTYHFDANGNLLPWPRRAVDCIGLYKSYIWRSNGDVKRNPATDLSANDTFKAARVKGLINTMPDIPGLGLHKDGHVGTYVGRNMVIEARGTKDGVVLSLLDGYGANEWTSWFEYPDIVYVKPTWKDVVSIAADHPEEWIGAIEFIGRIASVEGADKIKILKYIPDLLDKVYRC